MNIERLLKQFTQDPSGSATSLEQTADRALRLAALLRKLQRLRDSISRGGIADRVQMELIGPDLAVKQRVDTARK